jgi:hypothetical protein
MSAAAPVAGGVKRMARHLFKLTRGLQPAQRQEINEKIKSHFRTNLGAAQAEERWVSLCL